MSLKITDIQASDEPPWVHQVRAEINQYSVKMRREAQTLSPGELFELGHKIRSLCTRLEAGGFEVIQSSSFRERSGR